MEDTIDSGDGTITTNDPRPYVDCDGFNEHPRAQELRIEIERLFVKISKKNIAKDSIEEEGPFSIDL